jgi:hypothetical protein
MSRVFEGLLDVHYGQAYVLTGDMPSPNLHDAFRRQTNGLCGAAVRGALFLITGLHTGHVGFAVDVLNVAGSARIVFIYRYFLTLVNPFTNLSPEPADPSNMPTMFAHSVPRPPVKIYLDTLPA